MFVIHIPQFKGVVYVIHKLEPFKGVVTHKPDSQKIELHHVQTSLYKGLAWVFHKPDSYMGLVCVIDKPDLYKGVLCVIDKSDLYKGLCIGVC